MAEFRAIAKVSEVPVGRGLTARVGLEAVALFNIDGEIFALQGLCPHKGGPLGEGFCEGGKIYCPMHGWQFDIKTGACLDFPEKPAAAYRTRIVGDTIEVEL